MLNVRLTRSLRDIYSKGFLLDTLLRVVQSGDSEALARFQCQMLSEIMEHALMPSLIVTILDRPALNDPGTPLATVCANMDPSIWQLYREQVHLDHTRAHNRLRGVVVSTLDFGDIDGFRQTEIYNKFCAQAGRLHCCSVSYGLPNRADRVLRLNYDSGPAQCFPETLSRDQIEFFSLPFALAWLSVFDQIDSITLRTWLSRLIGMTPNRLAVIRELVCGTQYSHVRAAERLGIKPRTLHNHYAAIHKSVFFDAAPTQGNASQMTDLMRVFCFLAFMGKTYMQRDIDKLRESGILAAQAALR